MLGFGESKRIDSPEYKPSIADIACVLTQTLPSENHSYSTKLRNGEDKSTTKRRLMGFNGVPYPAFARTSRDITLGDIGPQSCPRMNWLRRYMGTKREGVGGKDVLEMLRVSAEGIPIMCVIEASNS